MWRSSNWSARAVVAWIRALTKRKGVIGAVVVISLVYILSKYLARRRRRRAARRAQLRAAQTPSRTTNKLQRLGFTPGKFLDLPSGKTHYLLVGPETGELIVLFHGFAIFTFVWQQLLEPLHIDQKFRVLAFDFYGHGCSIAKHPATHTTDLYMRQATEVLEALNIKSRFNLLGHSMGGLMATVFATQHPQRIRRLVLTCPAGVPVRGVSDNFYMTLIHSAKHFVSLPFVGRLITKLLMKAIHTQVSMVHQISTKKRVVSMKTLCMTPSKLSRISSLQEVRQAGGRFVNMIDMCANGLAFQNQTNPNFSATVSDVLSNCDLFGDWLAYFEAIEELHDKFPTLVLWGDKDEFLPYSNCVKYLHPRMPRAKFVSFEDTDHFIFLNRPAEFLEAVFEFVEATQRKVEDTERQLSS